MKRLALLLLFAATLAQAQGWRAATVAELEGTLPTRAQVEKERIETEMRTASGIVDARGRIIAGVVLITAGYSAEGKYSHYLLVQSPIQIDAVQLAPGRYVFGWNRVGTVLQLHLYDANTGIEQGSATAHPMSPGTRVETFRIWPPADRSIVQIGRFEIPYQLRGSAHRLVSGFSCRPFGCHSRRNLLLPLPVLALGWKRGALAPRIIVRNTRGFSPGWPLRLTQPSTQRPILQICSAPPRLAQRRKIPNPHL